MLNSNEFFSELLKNQCVDVPATKKLKYDDLKRMSSYLTSSIFDPNICSIWNGYVTNANNISKGVYINFYFNGKKTALHRLLYNNFVGTLNDDEYLKFTCDNRGKCCNIHHLNKFKYIAKNIENEKKEQPVKKDTKVMQKPKKQLEEFDFIISF